MFPITAALPDTVRFVQLTVFILVIVGFGVASYAAPIIKAFHTSSTPITPAAPVPAPPTTRRVRFSNEVRVRTFRPAPPRGVHFADKILVKTFHRDAPIQDIVPIIRPRPAALKPILKHQRPRIQVAGRQFTRAAQFVRPPIPIAAQTQRIAYSHGLPIPREQFMRAYALSRNIPFMINPQVRFLPAHHKG